MHTINMVPVRWSWALLLMIGTAQPVLAQRGNTLGYIPGGFRRAMVEQASYPCPPEQLPEGPRAASPDNRSTDDIPDPSSPDAGVPADEYAPEVADLSSDAAFASASQSAAPNMIGDSIGFGGTGYINIGMSIIPFSPGGGRKFRVATNQSPLPQERVFYNFHLFDNALEVQGPTADVATIDVARHEFGWEWAFWNGMASAQLQIPFSNSIDSSLTGFDLTTAGGPVPDATDTEIGNLAIAFKSLLYQTDCEAFSLGLAIDLPTSSDVLIEDAGGAGALSIETDAVTLSPFAGWLYQSPYRWYAQGFLQVAIPVSDNDYSLNGVAGELEEQTLFYSDCGVGFWFYNSAYDGAGCGGCGSCDDIGVAGVVELHYTTSLDDASLVELEPGGATFASDDFDALDLSLGLAAHHNCWSLTPAVVLPLQKSPNRQFDVEWTVQINRRY